VADFDAWYRAAEARDVRYDGRLFIGVRSTGVYCRPVCPTPMPKRANVVFFPHAAGAEAAGFRACRRCRPERSPGAPGWDLGADAVGRALRLIDEGALDDATVPDLARRLAVGPRHLHRLFALHVGASPTAVARTRRAPLAKRLLEDTDLPSSDVAWAAGFGSVRSYNDVVRRVYGRSPAELRRRRRPAGAGGLHLRLPLRPPFAGDGVLAFLAARAVPGVESVTGDTYAREGTELVVGADAVAVRLSPGDTVLLRTVAARTRRLFDLDADSSAVDAALAADPLLRPLVERAPGTRLPGAWDEFEVVVRAVVGQQVTVASARRLLARLVDACGTAGRFPAPDEILAADLSSTGLTSARQRTLRAVAGAGIALDGSLPPDGVADALRAVAGVGPWTASYVALRLGDTDAFPPGDAALHAAAARLGLPVGDRALLAHAERWRPWRGYAAIHLWQAAGGGARR
jgi:AraC family transcriptional regulator of adaptative response / DNA-3-methyladenine glycosylase II